MKSKGVNDVIPDVTRIFVSVDEGGDIGSNTEGMWYILCGCSVHDRVRFADATKHFGFVKEMKFRKSAKRRTEVLTYADPAIRRIYYVATRKDQSTFTPMEQKTIHDNALGMLSDLILSTEQSRFIDVEIDHNDLIDDERAESLFEKNRFSKGRAKARAISSEESYEMQTHDFIVGAIGKLYNRCDERYAELLTAPKFCILTSSDMMKSVSPTGRSRQAVRNTAGGQNNNTRPKYKKTHKKSKGRC